MQKHGPVAISGRPGAQGTVYGVILNHRRSLAGLGDTLLQAPYKSLPQAPVLYIKPANTLVASGATVLLPSPARQVEVGATLGIVIGAAAARIGLEQAATVIAGYVAAADLSLPHASYYRPAIREKCFDGACPISQQMMPASLANDPDSVCIETHINDTRVDSWPLADLVRNIPELLRDVTEFMTLNAGDILLIGVPWQAPQATIGDAVRVAVAGGGEVCFHIQSHGWKKVGGGKHENDE
ncbi:fumarylacetoacetate hydrolase family protein [Paraherbaspirillum soli]|uniref:Fumarylacetoacetate hydrolase family protein n=1 Tax=Paraherbaspirillum soli TaxID=631222 RepID=A0ABW0MH44_9BURK